MHEDVALEFARWLSPAFAIWCNDRIKELLTFGLTATPQTIDSILADPDNAIRLLTALKEERQQRQLAESKAALLEEVTKEQAPKVEYFEHFMTAEHGETNAGIREVVKQAHIKSEKRFVSWMISKQILFRQKKDNRLQPYAEYAKYFDYKDVHDKDNDWSGKHLKFNPYGKMYIVNKYHVQHPEEFEDTKDLFNQ
jgi:phage antirepressor YoqD-like protein